MLQGRYRVNILTKTVVVGRRGEVRLDVFMHFSLQCVFRSQCALKKC